MRCCDAPVLQSSKRKRRVATRRLRQFHRQFSAEVACDERRLISLALLAPCEYAHLREIARLALRASRANNQDIAAGHRRINRPRDSAQTTPRCASRRSSRSPAAARELRGPRICRESIRPRCSDRPSAHAPATSLPSWWPPARRHCPRLRCVLGCDAGAIAAAGTSTACRSNSSTGIPLPIWRRRGDSRPGTMCRLLITRVCPCPSTGEAVALASRSCIFCHNVHREQIALRHPSGQTLRGAYLAPAAGSDPARPAGRRI